MVPEDSSAARIPLPGATMAVAILLSSVRFIERSSQNDSALACEVRPFSGNCRVNVGRRVKGGGQGFFASARLRGEPECARSARIPGEGDSPRVQLSPSPGRLPLTPTLSPQAGRGGDRAVRDRYATLGSSSPLA